MANKLILFLILHFFLPNKALSEFIFNGFRDVGSKISLDGSAEIEENGILKLTNDTSRLFGHAFFETPFRFKNSSNGKSFSFSTAFSFVIVPEYEKLGGHGLAFTISKSKEIKGALPSQYLGLMNANDVGNFSNHVLAVEFDTVQDFEFGDINDSHVGIDINSLVSNASVNTSCFSENDSIKQGLNLKSGKRIQAWIDYDSRLEELRVTLSLSSSKPNSPILSFPVDLSPFFLEFMYVGFSASTGLLASSHYVLGWSFMMNGQAKSLDLSLLPSLPYARKRNHFQLILGISFSVVVILVGLCFYIVKKIKNRDVVESWELDVGPHRFAYRELNEATRGFRDKELLGFGGFGKVYKGKLPNSNAFVAVKRINHGSEQGFQEFMSEISSIGRLRHRNLVQLLGWCRKRGDLLLVYEFMPNGSLDKYIFDEPERILSWEERFKIIKDVAHGLLYLHEEWEQAVIHRDIKAGNVLLDAEMNGKLGDFGLAKLYEHGSNPSTTKVVGTLGYLAPELTKTGKPTTSSDVFAFGSLLLEVVCGRKPVETKAMPEELFLLDWVWDKWRGGSILEVVDRRLRGDYDEVEVVMVLKLGLMCSNNAPAKRPNMRQVVRFLEGETALPEVLVASDGLDNKNFNNDGSIVPRHEDLMHSYPLSSCYDKVMAWSSFCDGEDNGDLKAGSTSST